MVSSSLFYCLKKEDFPENKTVLLPVTDNFVRYSCIEYTLPWGEVEVTNIVVETTKRIYDGNVQKGENKTHKA